MRKEDPKVVPLPGLHERYIEKGIEQMRDHHYTEAEQSFLMALELGESTKAHFGMVMVLYQLGKLTEAKDYCERLLELEIQSNEEFFEYLQVFLTILRELKNYKRATDLLKTSLQKQYIPLDKEEQCHEWLDFFLEKCESDENSSSNPENLFESWQQSFFDNGQTDSELTFRYSDEIREYYMKEIDRIKEALEDQNGDPYIKSIILHDLKLNQLNVTVSVHKFGKECSVNIGEMKDVTDSAFFSKVKDLLVEKLESENPTLYQMAGQLWEHFMVTIFPIPLDPEDPPLWAAAVYTTVHLMNGMEKEEQQVADSFGIPVARLLEAIDQIKEAESSTSI